MGARTAWRRRRRSNRSSRLKPSIRDQSPMCGGFGHCACSPIRRSIARRGFTFSRPRSICRASVARLRLRRVSGASAMPDPKVPPGDPRVEEIVAPVGPWCPDQETPLCHGMGARVPADGCTSPRGWVPGRAGACAIIVVDERAPRPATHAPPRGLSRFSSGRGGVTRRMGAVLQREGRGPPAERSGSPAGATWSPGG